jgi:hypothetical protein
LYESECYSRHQLYQYVLSHHILNPNRTNRLLRLDSSDFPCRRILPPTRLDGPFITPPTGCYSGIHYLLPDCKTRQQSKSPTASICGRVSFIATTFCGGIISFRTRFTLLDIATKMNFFMFSLPALKFWCRQDLH